MKTNIKGVGVALITPFNDNGDVDFEALERLLERVAAEVRIIWSCSVRQPKLRRFPRQKRGCNEIHRKQKRRPDAGCDRDQR